MDCLVVTYRVLIHNRKHILLNMSAYLNCQDKSFGSLRKPDYSGGPVHLPISCKHLYNLPLVFYFIFFSHLRSSGNHVGSHMNSSKSRFWFQRCFFKKRLVLYIRALNFCSISLQWQLEATLARAIGFFVADRLSLSLTVLLTMPPGARLLMRNLGMRAIDRESKMRTRNRPNPTVFDRPRAGKCPRSVDSWLRKTRNFYPCGWCRRYVGHHRSFEGLSESHVDRRFEYGRVKDSSALSRTTEAALLEMNKSSSSGFIGIVINKKSWHWWAMSMSEGKSEPTVIYSSTC